MKFLVLVIGIRLVLGFEGQVFRPQLKHKPGIAQFPTTCSVRTRTVTETITISTCVPEPQGTPKPKEPRKKKCGNIVYDRTKYVCRRGLILCPIINGEPFSLCDRTCYSTLVQKCHNNTHVQPLPELTTRFTLYASNPQHPGLHNTPVTVCNHTLRIGGRTCSYCPPNVPSCPPGNITVFNAANTSSMAAMVPGGQALFITTNGELGVGRAHSGSLPPGARVGGFKAYEDGAWIREDVQRWEACGKGPIWRLRGRNGTEEKGNGTECFGVNLRVRKAEGLGAWEYT